MKTQTSGVKSFVFQLGDSVYTHHMYSSQPVYSSHSAWEDDMTSKHIYCAKKTVEHKK